MLIPLPWVQDAFRNMLCWVDDRTDPPIMQRLAALVQMRGLRMPFIVGTVLVASLLHLLRLRTRLIRDRAPLRALKTP